MGGSPQSTSGAAPTGNPIFDNLFGQLKDKQAAAAAVPAPTGVQQFGTGLTQVGNNLMAQSMHPHSGAQQPDPLQQGLTTLGNAMVNHYAPHNNVATPVDRGPNLFGSGSPVIPSFGAGGEPNPTGGGIGAQPAWGALPPRTVFRPQGPVNLSASVANATPSLFGK